MRSNPHSLLRMLVALSHLLFSTSCATPREGALDGVRPRLAPKKVRMSELPGGQLKLFFEPAVPDPALEMLEVEKARAALAAFHESLPPAAKARLRG